MLTDVSTDIRTATSAVSCPLKILQVVESTCTGVGRHVIDLTAGCLARGHAVDLCYSPLRADQQFDEGLRALQGSLGFRAIQLPIRRELAITDILLLNELRSLAANNDVVHCHSTKAGLLGRLSSLGVAPSVYTAHGFLTLSPQMGRVKKTLVGLLERGLARIGAGVIAVSNDEYHHALQLGIPHNRLFVVPNGIQQTLGALRSDQRRFLRELWKIGESDICIGFVGRLCPQKAVGNLLRAVALLTQAKKSSIRLAIVGEGPDRAALETLAVRLNIAGKISWCGAVKGIDAMAAFDIFALPSDYEGLPYVLLEAMLSGVPVVSTRVGGVAEIIEPPKNGLIIPPGQPAALAEGLWALIEDEALRTAMGDNARQMVRTFSVDRMVDATIHVYRSVLAKASTRNRAAAPAHR